MSLLQWKLVIFIIVYMKMSSFIRFFSSIFGNNLDDLYTLGLLRKSQSKGRIIMSRTAKSIKNIKYSLIGQIFGLLANFITIMVFVRVLSAEYLGINGLFTNILSILAFAELGIGPAIVYSMYKPLADKDIGQLKGLMNLFRKAYISIGFFILIIGSSLSPFLSIFVKEVPDISNLRLIYLLFVFNTASSYFFSYKR